MRVHTPCTLDRRSNQNETYLKIRLRKANDGDPCDNVGFAPGEWQVPAGNVIAVLADKKPLNTELMQVLCDFCYVRMTRVLSMAAEREESESQIQKIIEKEINRKAFMDYAGEYRTREIKKDRSFK